MRSTQRFVLRRKKDGLFRRKSRYGSWKDTECWTDDLSKAQIFRTTGGAKHAVYSYLYESVPAKNGVWQAPIKHPEWFDLKFEIVEAKVTI